MEIEQVKEKVKLAYKALDDKKAKDITVLDISRVTVVADYFIIASAENNRQIGALADNVDEVLGRAGYEHRAVEGYDSGSWILMDYSDIIVHIFNKEDRMFYDLERIWRDGKRVDVKEL